MKKERGYFKENTKLCGKCKHSTWICWICCSWVVVFVGDGKGTMWSLVTSKGIVEIGKLGVYVTANHS